ncbi:MAG TPA: 16S rRNA (cytosine(1402)-N(4))-methyltransferase RsmH, partial [Epsilonproteobacteria bacterium]|nr:16S rRNA (cytosine(1402)-N(4))-methyltransferase RsmH [Campylobacterota bacterium]
DCTVGYGGHSEAMLVAYPHLLHIGIDRDREALDFSAKRLEKYKTKLYKGSFSKQFPVLNESPIVGVLADFGVSSLQLDKAERGFSFDSQRLDMRMDTSASLSAYDVVNSYTEEQLRYIFEHYGEVRQPSLVAKAIIHAREKKPIQSAKDLADIISTIFPKRGKIHPATLIFQAIRIEVNDELGEIESLLDSLERQRTDGMIVSFITFHSLEDRLIKNRFNRWSKECICPPEVWRCTCGKNNALGKMINRKPITATPKEAKLNPRSRSAKLRSFCFDGVKL